MCVCCDTHGLVSPMPVLGLGRVVEKVQDSGGLLCPHTACLGPCLRGKAGCRDGDLISVWLEAGNRCS